MRLLLSGLVGLVAFWALFAALFGFSEGDWPLMLGGLVVGWLGLKAFEAMYEPRR